MVLRVGVLVTLFVLLTAVPVRAQTTTPTTTPTQESTPVGTLTGTPGATSTPTGSETPGTEDEDCPMLVQSALDLTKSSCEMIGNNEVCYGHSTLQAAARPGTDDFAFDVPGDIEDVIEMQSLSLSPLNTALAQWGVILMQVQAEVAALANERVTFVVFGNTELTAPTTFDVTATQNANIRRTPDAGGEILGVIASGTLVTALGRTADNQWLRVRTTNTDGGTLIGWTAASLIGTDLDIEILEIITETEPDATSPLQYGPMKAFYFQSGVDDAPCAAAPNSGMMIQTPEGQATVTLWIDEVIIELDGTAYLQADPDGDLTVTSLDGGVSVTAEGETRTAVAGTQISVPLDEDLTASAAPNDPVPLDPDNVSALPTTLLPDEVTIPAPLEIREGVPATGNWRFTWEVSEATCPDGKVFTFESSGIPNGLVVNDDGTTINWGGRVYNQQSTGLYTQAYVGTDGNLYQERLTVVAFDRINGEATIDLVETPCTLVVPFQLQLVIGG